MKITDIQIFQPWHRNDERAPEFSANIAIDDRWMLQLGTDGRFSIPRAAEAAWREEADQEAAREEYDADEVARELRIPTTADELRAMGAEDMI